MPWKPNLDDEGRNMNTLDDIMCDEVAVQADIDEQLEWEASVDEHEDEFTGEAIIDRDLEQRYINVEVMGELQL